MRNVQRGVRGRCRGWGVRRELGNPAGERGLVRRNQDQSANKMCGRQRVWLQDAGAVALGDSRVTESASTASGSSASNTPL